MSEAIAHEFSATMRGQPPKLTHDDLLRLYPVVASTAPVSSDGSVSLSIPSLDQVRYYSSDFAASPDELNAKYNDARKQAELEHGRLYVLMIQVSDKHHELKKYRRHDFRFTDAEKLRLQQHGFMVTERLAEKSFADVYYKLYTDDMPVYVTSDSVLHAWHRSFDAFLMDLEMKELMPLVHKMLVRSLAEVAVAYDATAGREDVRSVLGDVELFLAVAHRLLLGEPFTAPPKRECPAEEASHSIKLASLATYFQRQELVDTSSSDPVGEAVALHVASNSNRRSALVELVEQEQLTKTDVFGAPREVDFSLFKPRGHYTKTENLQRFFRAMVWLGTIDFRVDGTARNNDEDAKANERRQLQCACLLVHILEKAGVMPLVKTLHDTIGAIAGDGVGADSMTPIQLSELLAGRDVLATFFGPKSDDQLRALQDEIANAGLGAQAISGHPMKANPISEAPTRPPTAFAFVGQQFVWSAFVFSKLVFDKVIDEATGQKVPRRMVSAVDAAFALFGNNVAGVEITKRMQMQKDNGGEDLADRVAFRDGLPYAPSLLAARAVVDEAMDKASEDPGSCSLALLWQLALRELSRPASHSDQVFASEAWQKRQMNTQIASFTQLRHDTLLYAKQGITVRCQCEYPAGFVDPYPSFWTAMQQLAERAIGIISTLAIVDQNDEGNGVETTTHREGRECFEKFATVCGQLAAIADAQAAGQALTETQLAFLKNVIEHEGGSDIYRYLGWYPSLFYTSREDSGKPDHLVADVHTDAPSDLHGDPGGVLHLGVGDVNLGVFVVDGVMYAGPVFSHYEFVTPIDERLTDDEFSARLGEFESPKWATESFVVTQ